MIKVYLQPEPKSFNNKVRVPGNNFLKQYPQPNADQFNVHSYWREVGEDLHNSYSRICAYSCQYIPLVTGSKTVEHFLPKVKYPHKAYEWSNYRLVCSLLNSRKRESEITDPFEVEDSWFQIQFPSLQIHPDKNLPIEVQKKITDTITILKLNIDPNCVQSRTKYISDYCGGHISFDFLNSHAPFIARELKRQNLEMAIKDIWNPLHQ
jgi:uncharacterized protein (TIGR02646 family)